MNKRAPWIAFFISLAWISTASIFIFYTVIHNIQHKLSAQQQQLDQQQKALQQMTVLKQQQYWQFGAIRFLIQLANNRVQFAQDIQASYDLLTQAHQIIIASHNHNFDALDQALQQDMQMLSTITKGNTTPIFLHISQVTSMVASMPLLTIDVIKKSTPTPVAADMTLTWQDKLQKTWQELHSLIVIRKLSDPLVPLMTQQEGEYIRQYLLLQLGEAQWAAQRYQGAIYHATLHQAMAWIEQYFVANNPITQQVMSELEKLQQQEVALPTVTLNKTFMALQQVAEP